MNDVINKNKHWESWLLETEIGEFKEIFSERHKTHWLRVPGGWIVSIFNNEKWGYVNPCFVPSAQLNI